MKTQIINAITERNTNLSARGIAEQLKMDATSENLRNIETAAFELYEAGSLQFVQTVEDGPRFYGLVAA